MNLIEQPVYTAAGLLPVEQGTVDLLAVHEDTSLFPSRALSEAYFELRDKVLLESRVEGEELAEIQEKAGAWVRDNLPQGIVTPFAYEDYAEPSYEKVMGRFESFSGYLKENHSEHVLPEEIEATRLFLESSFAMYTDVPKDGSVHPDADASFAFVVPTRLSRKNVEYGAEGDIIMPILRYLPNEMRAAFAIGLPPCIIDTYSRESDGKRGYLVLAPLFTDMMEDLPLRDALRVGDKRVNDTVDFAYQRLGAEVQGLGAIIPSLTKFGQKITNRNVITTTGHGGTIELIMKTIDRALSEEYITSEQLNKIGVLGLGSIGQSIAEITRRRYPDSELRVFDVRAEQTRRVAESIGGIAVANEAALISESEVIISAITDTIDLESLALDQKDLRNKLIVDDSQPCSFNPEQVRQWGGKVAWVIGTNAIERANYDFGGSMADARRDIFGCEAEAAAVAAYYRDLKGAGIDDAKAREIVQGVALRGPVTAEKAVAIGELFVRYGVEAAPLQAFGQYLR